MKLFKSLISLTFFICLPTTASIAAPNNTNQALSKINQQISQLQQVLAQDRQQQTQLNQQLQHTVQAVDTIKQNLETMKKRLTQQQTTLIALQSHGKNYQENLQTQHEMLAQQLYNAYKLFLIDYWQVLFNQVNPNDLARSQRYFYYIHQAHLNLIDNLKQNLAQLKQQQHHLKIQQTTAQSLLNKQQHDQAHLLAEKAQHQLLLTQLSKKIQNNNQILAQRLADKRALETILRKLEKKAQTEFPTDATAFYKLQGKLPWPNPGQILRQFGTAIQGSDLNYTGVTIKATAGQPVRAIYSGKVVFSDWLQGLGLLIIIDHNNRFMTLYGHNQILYKKVGSTVKAGDVIAAVGNTGSNSKTAGLYFEIRQQGKPVDPSRWCR